MNNIFENNIKQAAAKPAAWLAAILAAMSMAACGNKTTGQPAQIPMLTDSMRQVVTIQTVESRPYADELVLNGEVECDPNNVAHVFPMFGGTVVKMGATVGDYVRRGQVLAVVRSGEVADYAKQKNDADLQILTAKRNRQAMHDMYKGGMASDRDVMQADKEVKNANAERLRLNEIYAINHITSNSTYVITAPISGFITSANINPDMQIRPDQDDELFTIAGLDNVWIIANVYENDIPKVHSGADAHVTTLAYGDGRVFHGKVDKVYPVLNEDSKTENVKINMANPGYQLKPGMFANVFVSVPAGNALYPAVPPEAVIFDDDKDYVVVVDSKNVLSYHEVKVLKEGATLDYIAQGIEPGDRIIVHNALLVYNSLK